MCSWYLAYSRWVTRQRDRVLQTVFSSFLPSEEPIAFTWSCCSQYMRKRGCRQRSSFPLWGDTVCRIPNRISCKGFLKPHGTLGGDVRTKAYFPVHVVFASPQGVSRCGGICFPWAKMFLRTSRLWGWDVCTQRASLALEGAGGPKPMPAGFLRTVQAEAGGSQ